MASNRTATSEAAGNVIFTGNFESGNVSQWTWGAQCANYGNPSLGSLHLVTEPEPVAQGKYAARFDLPAAGTTNACEVLRRRTEALGTDDWYAQEVYFPTNWREPAEGPNGWWGALVGQYNYENIGEGPPVGLIAHKDHVNVVIETGFCNPPICQYNSGNDIPGGVNQGTLKTTLRITPLETNLAGTWQQFIVHVHWASDAAGHVDGWWKPRAGGTWKQTVNWGGYPTVQWTNTLPVDTNHVTADKIGAYRGPAPYPLSLWQDGFCVATSFASAATCL